MYKRWGKRALDIALTLIALIPALPIVAVCALLVWREDKQPPFYISRRVGRGGRPFGMIKLRTMKPNSPDIRNPDNTTFSGAEDPRMTRIGKILRERSLDELPQLINVLMGRMSLVGPRPDLPDQQLAFTPEQLHKNEVRPGITGYNQAYYRLAVGMGQRLVNDVYYVEHLSFRFDVKILLKTVDTVLRARHVYTPTTAPDEHET